MTAPSPITLVDYFYTGSTSLVTYTIADNPFVVDPVECMPAFTYTCSNTGSRTDICSMSEDSGLTIGNFDTATESFTLQTTNMVGVPLDTYVVSIIGTVGLKSTTGQFTFNLVDPCPLFATITITTEIFSGPVTYILRDPIVPFSVDFASNMSVSGVSVDGNCGSLEVSFFLNDGAETVLDAEVFTYDTGPPVQFLINYVSNTLKAGIYDVTYKAYLVDYPIMETHSVSPMLVTVLDPCKSPTTTITSPTTLIDIGHYVGGLSQTYTIDPFTIYASWCTVTYSAASNEPALDSSMFTFDDVTQTFTFLFTNDLSLAGAPESDMKDYTITVTAIVDILVATADFTLTMLDQCELPARNQVTHPVGPFEELTYIVGTETAQYDFLEISGGGFAATV